MESANPPSQCGGKCHSLLRPDTLITGREETRTGYHTRDSACRDAWPRNGIRDLYSEQSHVSECLIARTPRLCLRSDGLYDEAGRIVFVTRSFVARQPLVFLPAVAVVPELWSETCGFARRP